MSDSYGSLRIVYNRHLSVPFLPQIRFFDEPFHETRHIDSAGLSSIKNCASGGGGMNFVFGYFVIVDQ